MIKAIISIADFYYAPIKKYWASKKIINIRKGFTPRYILIGTYIIILDIIGFTLILIPLFWPKLNTNIPGLNAIGSVSTYLYTVINFFVLLVISATAFIAYFQLSHLKKSRDSAVLLNLCQWHSSKEMYAAIKAVWNCAKLSDGSHPSLEEIEYQRRLVSDFWNMVGTMVMEGAVDPELIRSRFRDGPVIWEKLKDLEKEVQITRIKQRKASGLDLYPEIDMNDEESLKKLATYIVNEFPAAKLSKLWKTKGWQSTQSNDSTAPS